MKRILFFIVTLFFIKSLEAQCPTILGTYLPVANTEIKQVWIHPGVNNGPAPSSIPTPVYGANVVWDYSTLPSPIETGTNKNTYTLKTYHPDSSENPYPNRYPSATHVSYWDSPISDFDSAWTYAIVDEDGMHNIGFVNLSTGSTFAPLYAEVQDLDHMVGKQVFIPSLVDSTTHYYDSVMYEILSGPFPDNVTHQYKYKEVKTLGWGTLVTPIATNTEVLLVRESIQEKTYVLDQLLDTVLDESRNIVRHFFLRNNTFATSVLMQLERKVNSSQDTITESLWYTLPSKVGTIEGTVYDSIGSSSVVNSGEVYLYREYSNFSRDDILATAQIGNHGVYLFEDIPYGMYRLAARADASFNGSEHMYTTYFEDTASTQNNPALGVDWRQCDLVTTTGPTTVGKDIYMRHDTLAAAQVNAVPNQLVGFVRGNNLLKQGGDDPIPGIDVIIKKDPSSQPVISTQTDENGEFIFSKLPDGDYKIWVDMPGLGMNATYHFNVTNGVYNKCEYDFDVGEDDVFRENLNQDVLCITSIGGTSKLESNSVSIYPNPYNDQSTVQIELEKESIVTIEIYDLTGKRVDQLTNHSVLSGITSFAIKGLKGAGVYFVETTIDNKVSTQRLIKL